MKICVKVKPCSHKQGIEEGNGFYIVRLKSPPKDNKANIELLKLLKKYFKKNLKIKSGFNSRKKIIEILD